MDLFFNQENTNTLKDFENLLKSYQYRSKDAIDNIVILTRISWYYMAAPLIHFLCAEGLLQELKLVVNVYMADLYKPISCTGKLVAHTAASRNQLAVLKWLIQEKGIDVNIVDNHGATPLTHSCYCEEDAVEVVEWLLKHPKIDVNCGALGSACSQAKPKIVQLLLNQPKIDVNKEFKYGPKNVFVLAAKGGSVECLQLLLAKEKSLDVNSFDMYGKYALHYFLESSDLNNDAFQLLLKTLKPLEKKEKFSLLLYTLFMNRGVIFPRNQPMTLLSICLSTVKSEPAIKYDNKTLVSDLVDILRNDLLFFKGGIYYDYEYIDITALSVRCKYVIESLSSVGQYKLWLSDKSVILESFRIYLNEYYIYRPEYTQLTPITFLKVLLYDFEFLSTQIETEEEIKENSTREETMKVIKQEVQDSKYCKQWVDVLDNLK